MPRWPRRMVTVATNLGAREALEKNVIDVLATDYPDLPPDRRHEDGAERADDLDPARHDHRADPDVDVWKRLLDLLIDPNIIALMLSIGLIGIVVELWNPGLIFPGPSARSRYRRSLRAPGAACLDRRAAPDAARCRLLRRRGVHRLARGARARGRDHLRDRRADALRPSGRRVPGVPSGRARDRRNARAPVRFRADEGRAGTANAGRSRRAPARGRAGEVRGRARLRRRRALARATAEAPHSCPASTSSSRQSIHEPAPRRRISETARHPAERT